MPDELKVFTVYIGQDEKYKITVSFLFGEDAK